MDNAARDDPPDEVLVLRAQNGDVDAFQRLFERYEGVLRTRILRLLPERVLPRVSVSDVVQETRIVALRRCATFEDRGPGAFRAWILRIGELKARETLQTHLGTAHRTVDREAARGERPDTQDLAAKGRSPSEAAIAGEEEAAARRALESLPEAYRRVLQLARLEGRSLREVAGILSCSRESAKKLYARAVRRFTEAYASSRFDGRA